MTTKATKWRPLIAALSLFAVSSFAHAGTQSCANGAVHCAYITGMPSSYNEGRYLKIQLDRVGTFVFCFNSWSAISILQNGGAYHLGTNSDQYFICNDAMGSQCELVGTDTYEVAGHGGTYDSKPMYYPIDLTNFYAKYPPCRNLSGDQVLGTGTRMTNRPSKET